MKVWWVYVSTRTGGKYTEFERWTEGKWRGKSDG